MQLLHRGMGISESDWTIFLGNADATLRHRQGPLISRAPFYDS